MLLLYENDIITFKADFDGTLGSKNFLNKKLRNEDLRSLRYFLGIQVTPSSYGYILSQVKYELISQAGITNDNTVASSLEINVALRSTDGKPLKDATLYHKLVGSLVYLIIIRPGITYVVHIVS